MNVTTQINLENMLSETNQTQSCTNRPGCPGQANSQRQKVDQWLPRSQGWGKWGVTANMDGVSFGGDEMFLNQIVVMIVESCEYNKNH